MFCRIQLNLAVSLLLVIFKIESDKRPIPANMKHTYRVINFRRNLCAIIVILFLCTLSTIYAQKFSTITGLALNGKSATSITMNIFLPGKGGNKTLANVNDQLPAGTRMVIPANAIVKLQSPGGTQVVKPTLGKPIEYTVEFTAQGENHVVKGLGAQIENSVKKIAGYNYRNTNEKGTTAASKGTVFIFTDLSDGKDEKATISTTEGTINIIDKVPCTINGKPIKNNRKGGVTTKSVLQTQSAGDNEFISSDEPLDYSSFDRAIGYINGEINSGETEPEDIADDMMCLGDLYMAHNEPQQAINPYGLAADYYKTIYGDDDLSTLEARLSLAQAHMEASNETQGSAIVTESIEILEEILDFDLDDLEFARENDDTEAEAFLCDEIIDLYDFLGWAFDIKGDQAQSDDYYNKAEAGCE